ncbi:hypothetical protein [Halosegnis marinus]|uniref:Uncharacterized protein n=1 Tax=Halosegnis marinus TaxID=3034023 RepID=A0ABD5ZSZ7_9EURY|nr:hypothetical protein [Halosegnis sp. DT85]
MSGVPDSGELVDNQATVTGGVTGWLKRYLGAIGAGFAFLIIAPVRAAAEGGGTMIAEFTTGLAELLGSLGFGSALIVNAGAEGTAGWVATESIGFVLALGAVLVGGVMWTYALDLADSDLPFWQNVPVLGFFFSDNDEQ